MKIYIFLDIESWNPTKINRRFGGTYFPTFRMEEEAMQETNREQATGSACCLFTEVTILLRVL
jgi:hypothetical protein